MTIADSTNQTPLDYAGGDTRGGLGVQTWALLVDAYRQLNASKLFWVTLMLSVLVPAFFVLVGIGREGVSIWPFGTVIPGFSTLIMDVETFYKFLFLNFGINLWLAWIATILALIGTGQIFPDLLTGGSIDLYLSKPIGRLRLFLTKYAFGLMFAATQVAAFVVTAMIVMLVRGAGFEPSLLLAVPMVTLFFSFLFCVQVLLGVMTRSVLASVLLTILLWFGLFLINFSEAGLLVFREVTQATVEGNRELAERGRQQLAEWETSPTAPGEMFIETTRLNVEALEQRLPDDQRIADRLQTAHRIAYGIKAPLPKTGETIELIRRWLIGNADLPNFGDEPAGPDMSLLNNAPDSGRVGVRVNPEDPEVEVAVREAINARSAAWILGSSLAFEAVVLALAAWLFVRRDY
jgi:ABC-type transport system involved in multi-copper enzyme maturation permease subunit